MVEQAEYRILRYLRLENQLRKYKQEYMNNNLFFQLLQTKSSRTSINSLQKYTAAYAAYQNYKQNLPTLIEYKKTALANFDILQRVLETTKTLLYPKQQVKKLEQQIEEKKSLAE